MRRLAVILETVHAAALGVWLGGAVMTAVTAALIFPLMKDLDPALPGFAEYPHGHGVIAAGWVMARVFAWYDALQMVCGTLAALTLAWRLLIRRHAPVRRAAWRSAALLVTAAVTVSYLLLIAQPMHADLTGFWEAAQAGQVERADSLRASFDARHPAASRAMSVIALSVLVSLVLALLSEPKPAEETT